MLGKKGFTLVEMLFVLIIAAGIMAYAIPSYKRTKVRAQYDAATGNLVKLGSAMLALESDLEVQGIHGLLSGGFGKHVYEFGDLDDPEMLQGEQTLKNAFDNYKSSHNEEGAQLQWLLAFLNDEKYLDNGIGGNEPYTYYVMTGTHSCQSSDEVAVSGVIAYMNPLEDEYSGAMFTRDGRIIKGTCHDL